MARIRYLKPEFFTDEDIGSLPPLVRIFYQGLWTQADREGRLEYRPRELHIKILPYDKIDPHKFIELLTKPKTVSGRPFIKIYQNGSGKQYIQILSWLDHQNPHHTEKQSTIPAPPTEEACLTVKAPLNNESITGYKDKDKEKEKDKEKDFKESQRIAKPQKAASPPAPVPKTMSEPQKLVEEAVRIYKEGTGEEYRRTDKDYGIAAKMVKSYGFDLAMAKLNAFGRFCKGKTVWFTKEGFADFSLGALWHHWNAIIRAPDKEANPNAPPGQSAVKFFVSPEYKDSREQIEAAKQKYGSNWWRYLGGAK